MRASVSLQTFHYRIPLPETVRLEVESYADWSFGVDKNIWLVAPSDGGCCEAILYVDVKGRNGLEACNTNVMMIIICAVHKMLQIWQLNDKEKWYRCTFWYFVRNAAGREFPLSPPPISVSKVWCSMSCSYNYTEAARARCCSDILNPALCLRIDTCIFSCPVLADDLSCSGEYRLVRLPGDL